MTWLCVDTSAWHHSTAPAVADAWRRQLEVDTLALCDQARLEILYSARSAADYDALSDELDALHHLPSTEATWARALDVQQRLAHKAGLHHRSVKIADLLIAAAAEHAGAVVWHYDADFDRIAAVTGQPVEWVAPRGSI
jgi:predicted nucleic acid-binding protein